MKEKRARWLSSGKEMCSMEKIRKYILVKGRVQRVGFRYHALQLAMECKVTGWVRNLANGTVEMEVQGTVERVELFCQEIRRGTDLIRIDDMSVADSFVVKDETVFRITYSR